MATADTLSFRGVVKNELTARAPCKFTVFTRTCQIQLNVQARNLPDVCVVPRYMNELSGETEPIETPVP